MLNEKCLWEEKEGRRRKKELYISNSPEYG